MTQRAFVKIVPSRGHRQNIFNPTFNVVGIAFGSHSKFHSMCVIDFAHDFIEYSYTLSSPKPSQMPTEVLSNGCLTFPQKSYLKKKI